MNLGERKRLVTITVAKNFIHFPG